MDARLLPTVTSWKSLLPSGVASLVLHALLLVCATSTLRGCQKGQVAEPGGDVFREVGLFVVQGSDSGADADAGTADADGQPSENSATPPVDKPPAETAQPAVDVSTAVLPREAPSVSQLLGQQDPLDNRETLHGDSTLPPLIGPGAPLSGAAALSGGGAAAQINPSGAAGQQAVGAVQPGPGQTAFMNIADSGRSFVYVIDISGSMGEDNRLELARSQLKASLRLLQPTQEFQVIFYSDYPTRLKLRGQGQRATYYATTANLLLAAREIDAVQPQHGTEHKPALMDAISLKPDVIYFLTDGREPPLYPADINDIRRVTGSTTIHVIEFGGAGLIERGESWLQKLARQSGGEYRQFTVGGAR